VVDGAAPALRARAHQSKLAFLDGLRGLAAFYVMVGHARWLLWEGYSEGYRRHPDHYSLAGKVIVHAAVAFRWGHEAVIFFFVLSGFVIHLKYAKRVAAQGTAAVFDLGPYLYRRARRLYPPLIVALLVTLGLDLWGQHLQLATAHGTTLYDSINVNVGWNHRPITALRNLVFIMDPVFGSDGPLWSLNYEWYFYLLYPLVFLISRRSPHRATLLLIVLSAVGFAPIWPRSWMWLRGVFQLMIVWWFGALLADRFAGRFRVRYATLSWLTPALLVVPFWRWDTFVRDIIVGLGFTGLIAACFAALEKGRSLELLARLRPLGTMSYTLYVVHFPILVFMSGMLMRSSGGRLPEHFGWVGAGIALCTALAYAAHFVVERPFTSR
jgi:peptidoglycan/LPS O-acetylase OafA/YrhL